MTCIFTLQQVRKYECEVSSAKLIRNVMNVFASLDNSQIDIDMMVNEKKVCDGVASKTLTRCIVNRLDNGRALPITP